MSKWLGVLNVAAGAIVLRSIFMLVTGTRPFQPSVEQCYLENFQSYLPVYVVLFYTFSAFVCVVFWPVVYDAMSRPEYRESWNELNIARWMLVFAAVLEGFFAWYWGGMPCLAAAMPHTGAMLVTALAELLVAGIIFYVTLLAQRNARKTY